MANRKAGSTGEGNAGNAGDATRPAAAKKAAGSAARKGAAKKSAGPAAKSAAGGETKAAGRGRGKPNLRGDLRKFVDENPHGWEHDQWEGLLGSLRERGHDTSNPDDIGMQLERERLASRLEGVEGVSSQRARSIAERFGTLHSLRQAAADDLERVAGVSRDLAERIRQHLS